MPAPSSPSISTNDPKTYHAIVERVPAGPRAFLTPFNFPLNLVAHKVLPAVAVGCPFVVRPSIKTPLTALLLGELLANANLPIGSWSILPSDHEAGDPLITDDRVTVLSFTGSPDIGWMLKARAGKKRVILELGNNSAVIVEPDADLQDAIPRIVTAAFGYAGQSCISVQRIFLHDSIADRAIQMLIEQTRALKLGDPLDETTDVGPLIDEPAALRVESWIQEALNAGAKQLTGSPRQGNFLPPTLLENVPPTLPISCQEAFGPIAVITRYSDFDAALAAVNSTRFGLQAGLFTRDLLQNPPRLRNPRRRRPHRQRRSHHPPRPHALRRRQGFRPRPRRRPLRHRTPHRLLSPRRPLPLLSAPSKFLHSPPSFPMMRHHIHHQIIPILKPLVHNRLPRLRLVILMHTPIFKVRRNNLIVLASSFAFAASKPVRSQPAKHHVLRNLPRHRPHPS